ncbi:MAG: hypothetical protein HZB76_00105 [Chlamydiae bacterium]|nr:hypothetical protein [Chlamydiota bacterium]
MAYSPTAANAAATQVSSTLGAPTALNASAVQSLVQDSGAGALASLSQTLAQSETELKEVVVTTAPNREETAKAEEVASQVLPPSHKKQLIMNASLILATTLSQAMLNRYYGNNDLGPKAKADGINLLLNMIFSSFISQLVKLNWRKANSIAKQVGVLSLYVASTLGCDAAAIAMIKKNGNEGSKILGQATVLAMITSFGYISKMCASSVRGRATWDQKSERKIHNFNEKITEAVNLGLVSGISFATAAYNLASSLGSSTSVFFNNGFSRAFGALGKAVIKSLTSKTEKNIAKLPEESKEEQSKLLLNDCKNRQIKAVLSYLGLAIASSALAGAIYPLQQDPNASVVKKVVKVGLHYFGPASGIAITGVLTNLLPRIGINNLIPESVKNHIPTCVKNIFSSKKKDKKEKAPKTPISSGSAPVKKQKEIPSLKKRIIQGGAFVATTIGAAALHSVNNVYFGANSMVSLAIKLFQAGWSFHSIREVLKGMNTDPKKIATILAVLATGVSVEMVSRTIDPSRKTEPALMGFWGTAAITAGTAATFFGKWVRNKLVPKNE